MRKAFDANVPKLKPRLKLGGAAAVGEAVAEQVEAPAEAPVAPAPVAATLVAAAAPPAAARAPAPASAATPTPAPTPTSPPPSTERASANHPSLSPAGEGRGEASAQASAPATVRAKVQEQAQAQVELPEVVSDVLSRRERLEKIKRKVAEAARPQPKIHPVPADPARAAESVLGLVRDLELELVRAREREEALRGDLEDARRELGRAAAEGRTAVERLATTEKELEEKRSVLGELLGEMQALEEERDESVRRAQALAALDEERAKLLEDLGRRAEEEAKIRAEREDEVDRLSEELRLAGTEGARLRAAVGDLARERDQLGADLDRARGERDELAEAKKALEAVHSALAQARARIG